MLKKLLLLVSFIFICGALFAQSTTFSSKMVINGSTGDGPFAMASGFIDGDAFNDIVIGSNIGGTIEVYLNNGDKTFASPVLVSNTLGNDIGGVKLVDLDGINGLDILAVAYTNDVIAWYPNDGTGNFPTENIIPVTVPGASGLAVGLIDGDSDIDIAVTAYDGDEVIWLSSSGGTNPTFTQGANPIDNTLNAPGSVNLKDIDGDGDLDALVSNAQFTGNNDEVVIFRNELLPSGGGVVSFTKITPSIATGLNYVFNASFEDLDGDSNLDILVTELNVSPGAGNWYWFEDSNGDPFDCSAFSSSGTPVTTIGNPAVAQHRDLDEDGDKDLILSSGQAVSSTQLVWFEQIGTGSGTYSSEYIIDNSQSQTYVFTVNDFDNDADADLDIATIAYNQDDLTWFENDPPVMSIEDFDRDQIRIYPNPAKNRISLMGIRERVSIEIFDLLGKTVYSDFIGVEQSIDISDLQAGVYLIKLSEGKQILKLIKE